MTFFSGLHARFSAMTRGRRGRLILAMTGACLTGGAVLFITSAGALTGSTFEIDHPSANLYKSTGTDWCNETEPAGTHGPCTTDDLAPNFQKKLDDPAGANDNSFVGGTKQDSVPNACPGDAGCVGSGSIPGKGDLDRFYLANETSAGNNHTYVYMGFELLPVSSTSASVHQGIEFNQKYCDPNENPKGTGNVCSANGVTPQRTPGDLLFVYDLEGGANPVLTVRKWVTSGACEISQHTPPCWSPPVTGLAADASNNVSGSVVDPINPGAPRTIQQYRFGEAAVDLTASGLLSGCQGFASAYIVSRSSGNSDTAQMKDLISPIHTNINQCGTAKVIKQDDAGNALSNVKFNLYKDDGDGVYEPGTDDVKVGDCTTGTDGTCSIGGLEPGVYWFAEDTSTVGSNYSPASPDHQKVTVTAGSTATATFTNPRKHKVIVLVCHQGTNDLVKSDVSNTADPDNEGTVKSSIDNLPANFPATEAQICSLGGASFSGKGHVADDPYHVDVGESPEGTVHSP